MEKFIKAADKHAQRALDAMDFMWKNPETGYREWKANEYLLKQYRELGYEPVLAGNIPGFYVDVDTGRPGPTVAVMGEMDSLICATHPEADPETGYVHACGHCCQSAGLLGLAGALTEPGVLDGWCGKIRLMAVPAEELIEVEFREELRRKGIIKYFGGKVEFMYRGYMNGVDMAFMFHSGAAGVHAGSINKGSNGCMAKTVTFHGKSAHAGAAPYAGINALYACNQALSAVNALRETFKDDECVRFHPIITGGGTVVNAIPDTVSFETYIRGATMESILTNNEKINRAIAASAAALGAKVTISDRPGYSPRVQPMDLMLAAKEAMEAVLETVKWKPDNWGKGSTDMGDVSMVMPAVHPTMGGVGGTSHGNNYVIDHPETACVDMSKAMLSLLDVLLKNGAERALSIKENFVPTYESFDAYFAAIDKLDMDNDAVIYNEDGTVTLDYRK